MSKVVSVVGVMATASLYSGWFKEGAPDDVNLSVLAVVRSL